jgi:hypothetical protein
VFPLSNDSDNFINKIEKNIRDFFFAYLHKKDVSSHRVFGDSRVGAEHPDTSTAALDH